MALSRSADCFAQPCPSRERFNRTQYLVSRTHRIGWSQLTRQHYDLLIENGLCVFPWGEAEADIGVRQGRIVAIGSLAGAGAERRIDARGLHVLPGLIDPHVHLREPGDHTVETIETGTRAAVLGGICTVFDMPNTRPPVHNAETVQWKHEKLLDCSWCDAGFYVLGTTSNAAQLSELEGQEGVCGIKVFTGGSAPDLLVDEEEDLQSILGAGRRMVSFHSEDHKRLTARRGKFHVGDHSSCHAEWHDEESALIATQRVTELARQARRRIHILHVSTAEELDFLKDHKDNVTVEVLVNHLTLVAPDCYDRKDGYAVMNPPIRGRRHYDACWQAIRDGRVDTIGSDHSPHSREAKEKPWPDCSAGLTGVQTSLPLMLDHVNAGRLPLTRLVDLMCAGPARLYGVIGKGRLAVGYEADFTLVNLRHRRVIKNEWIVSPCGWTPFDGVTVMGWPHATIVRGNIVMMEGEVFGPPRGNLVRFESRRPQ